MERGESELFRRHTRGFEAPHSNSGVGFFGSQVGGGESRVTCNLQLN